MLNFKALVSSGIVVCFLSGAAIAADKGKTSSKAKTSKAKTSSAKKKAPAKKAAAKKAPAKKAAPTLKLNAKQKAVLAALHKALSNKDLGVRVEAVEKLLKVKPTPSYVASRLISALTGDGDPNARSVIAENLLKIAPKSEAAMDALGKATHSDKDVNVRITAFRALQACGKSCKRVLPHLKKSASSYDTLVRQHAEKAIHAVLGTKPKKKAAPKKPAARKAAAPKKAASKKPAARKAAPKKPAARKTAAKKPAARKSK